MAKGHTTQRIIKLFKRGLSVEQIARKIGRPDDLARVREVLALPTAQQLAARAAVPEGGGGA